MQKTCGSDGGRGVWVVDDNTYKSNSPNLKVYTNVRIMFNFYIFAIPIEPAPRFSKKNLS